MFTSELREQIRAEIIQFAEGDSRLCGGAITGSASVDQLDSWSDIDLAFGVRDSSELPKVLDNYTEKMYRDYDALHHLDVHSGSWIYRVFLLSNTLQVDLAFAPEDQFGARASTFKLVFGKTGSITHDPPTQFEAYVGWCWLYALHVRSSLKRDRRWQAEFFLSGMRDYLISLCCRRYQLPEKQGRGVDRLPHEEWTKFEQALVKSLDPEELRRVFLVLVELFVEEVGKVDPPLGSRLQPALSALFSTSG